MTFGATNLQKAFESTNVDALMKNEYLKYYDNTYNSTGPTWSNIRRVKSFTGRKLEFPAPLSFQGGVGSNRLPETNAATYGDVQIASRKMYATARIDRETLGATSDDKGAFVQAITEVVKKVTEADFFNHARAAMNIVNGRLGVIDTGGVTDNGSGNYTLVISSASWKEANWEEKMFCNIGTGNTDLFEITTVTPSTRTIVVQRQAGGTKVPAQADAVFMQGSEGTDIAGIPQVLQATSGSLYGITVGRRWQAAQILSYGSSISPQVINRLTLAVEKQCGKVPTKAVTSYKQYERLINQFEDQKRYPQPASTNGKVGFSGIQIMTTTGTMDVYPDRFCADDEFYALNPDYITYYLRPNSGFVKEDVSANPYGYLRVVDEDQFELRHANYGELFIAPPFHGVITGLTTA